MKYTIEIDYDLADKIFLDKFKEDYLLICKEIAYINQSQEGKKPEEFPPHIKEDFEACHNNTVAMEELFFYYMTPEDALNLINEGNAIRF